MTPRLITLRAWVAAPRIIIVAAVTAALLAGGVGNAVLVTLDGYGHLPFQDPSACVAAAETAYLTDLVVPAKGTVCAADHQPFDPDFGQPFADLDEPLP